MSPATNGCCRADGAAADTCVARTGSDGTSAVRQRAHHGAAPSPTCCVLEGPGVPDPPGRQGRRVAELLTLDGADCPRYPARSAVSRALLRQPGHGSPTLVGFGKKVVWAGRSQRACAQASTVASGVGRTRTARDASARVLLEPNEAFARSSFCRFSRVSSS